jgi:hypothetical protein
MEKIKVTYLNDSYPIDISVSSLDMFYIITDLESSIVGWIPNEEGTGRSYISIEKTEWLKLCDYRNKDC